MKNTIKAILFTLLIISAHAVESNNEGWKKITESNPISSQYQKGWRDGYKAGYCYPDPPERCIAPVAPVPPVPRVGEHSYQHGYNRGFQKGKFDKDEKRF